MSVKVKTKLLDGEMILTEDQANSAEKVIEALNALCKTAGLSEPFTFKRGEKDGKTHCGIVFALPKVGIKFEYAADPKERDSG
jgi:hypothetical protein